MGSGRIGKSAWVEAMTERERFEQWWATTKVESALLMIAAWTAWQARAELAEVELARIATTHRSNG